MCTRRETLGTRLDDELKCQSCLRSKEVAKRHLEICNVIDTVNRSTAGTEKKDFMLIRETTGLSLWFSEAP